MDIVNGVPGLRPDLTSECSAKPHYSEYSEWGSRVTARFDVRMLELSPIAVDMINGVLGLRPDLTSECSAKPHYSGYS